MKKALTGMAALLLAVGAFQLSNVKSDIESALATNDVTVTVNQGTITSYVPTALATTVSWTNSISDAVAVAATDVTVSGSVGTQSTLSPTAAVSPSGHSGYITLSFGMPNHKLAGYQGRTETTAAMTVTGAAITNNDYQKILFDQSGTTPTSQSIKRVDDQTSAKTILGSSGFCGSGVADGDDDDGAVNGEFSLGGGCFMHIFSDLKQNLSSGQLDALTTSLSAS